MHMPRVSAPWYAASASSVVSLIDASSRPRRPHAPSTCVRSLQAPLVTCVGTASALPSVQPTSRSASSMSAVRTLRLPGASLRPNQRRAARALSRRGRSRLRAPTSGCDELRAPRAPRTARPRAAAGSAAARRAQRMGAGWVRAHPVGDEDTLTTGSTERPIRRCSTVAAARVAHERLTCDAAAHDELSTSAGCRTSWRRGGAVRGAAPSDEPRIA